jgi:uncharacterized protein
MAVDEIDVEVVYAAAPHAVTRIMLRLPEGSTLADALRASGVGARMPAQELDALKTGVWGRVAGTDTPLRQGDRVELYRPLKVDPKEARRLRYRRDGLKRKGLSGTRTT